MTHELTREEYLAINPPPPLPPLPPRRVTSWGDVTMLCSSNSLIPEIREFCRRGGTATMTSDHDPRLRHGNEPYTTLVDYHIQGRELHRIFQVDVTPDYFLSIIREDMSNMLGYLGNYAPTGELVESWGPSPNVVVDFAGAPSIGTYERAAGISGSLPPSSTKSEWREAATRSKEWLLEHLTDEQRADFESKKYFVVKGQKSGNSYRIYTALRQMNIFLMPQDGARERNLCVVSKDKNIPILDQVLMQKLMIETKEDEFLELAGVSRYSLEREAREGELSLRYQQEVQAAQQHYADAMQALDVEMRQTTNAADSYSASS